LNVLNSILRNDYLTIIPNWYFLGGWLIIGYVTLMGLRNAGAISALLIPTAIVAAYTILAFALFRIRSLQIPLVWPIASFSLTQIGAVVLRWLEELKSKQQIKSIFASYISPGVMNNLLKDPDSIKLGGERKPVIIFFSDIRGFTSFSEGANEVDLVRQLNEYFEKMVACVSRYDGTLHKYIGDAIMAVWGDVLHRDEATDAKNAVRCALAMKKELVALNHFWRNDGRMDIKIGIGLNHGIVCVGNIGAPQRREFTVIGDAVNLASRLEGVTKIFHTDFCIGESVYNLLEGEFLARTLALLVVKGKTRPVRVYEVLEDLKGIEPMNFFSHEWVHRYESAFEHFVAREFTIAAELFSQCLQEKPGDFMSDEYHRAALAFIETPPGPEWDGVIKLESK
jgi:adenylate cyclase